MIAFSWFSFLEDHGVDTINTAESSMVESREILGASMGLGFTDANYNAT